MGLSVEILLILPILLFTIGIPLMAIIEIVKNPDMDSNRKVLWAVIVVFTTMLGGSIYLILHGRTTISRTLAWIAVVGMVLMFCLVLVGSIFQAVHR